MKKIIIPVIAVVLVLAAGSFYLLNSNKQQNQVNESDATEMTSNNTEQSSENNEFTESLDLNNRNPNRLNIDPSLQAALSGEPTFCTFTSQVTSDGQFNSQGQVYIDGERFSGKFSSQGPNINTTSNAISDSEFIYTWEQGSNEGVKLSLDVDETVADLQQLAPDFGTNPTDFADREFLNDNQAEYNCESWTVNESVFQIPSNVNFVDIQDQLQQLEDAFSSFDTSDSCSICESIPDDRAKRECLQSFSC